MPYQKQEAPRDEQATLKARAAARAWQTQCAQLEHLGRLLTDFARNPDTTTPEMLAEVSQAIRMVASGQGEMADWIDAGFPKSNRTRPLAKLVMAERLLKRRQVIRGGYGRRGGRGKQVGGRTRPFLRNPKRKRLERRSPTAHA